MQQQMNSKSTSKLLDVPIGSDSRRQVKTLSKKMQLAKLYFDEKLKPAQIAKKLRIGVEHVYTTTTMIKRNCKRVIKKAKELA